MFNSWSFTKVQMTEKSFIFHSGRIVYCSRCPTRTQMAVFLKNWSNKEMSLKTLHQTSGYSYSWLRLQNVPCPQLVSQSRMLKLPHSCDITWFPVVPETTKCTSQYSLRLPTTNANRPSAHSKHLNTLLSPLKHCEKAFVTRMLCYMHVFVLPPWWKKKESRRSREWARRHEHGHY